MDHTGSGKGEGRGVEKVKVLLGRRRGSWAWEREKIVEVGRLGGGQRKWGEMGLQSM